jgi:hypothetical protein
MKPALASQRTTHLNKNTGPSQSVQGNNKQPQPVNETYDKKTKKTTRRQQSIIIEVSI